MATVAVVAACEQGTGNRSTLPEGTIVLASTNDFRTLLLISPTTGHVTRLRAPDAVISLQADLSPDGRRFAIAGFEGIWTFTRNGRNPRRLPIARPLARFVPDWVTWSPSGNSLVFTLRGALFTAAADGNHVKKLLEGHAYAPDWSPRGDRIIFVRSGKTEALIQAVTIEGHDLRSIVRGSDPDVSPDGSTIAFSGRKGIYVVPMVGGKPKLIIRNARSPEWSPDGRFLAFTRNVDCGEAGCSGRVFIVRATGGRARALGPRIFDIGPLSWSD